MQSIAQRNKQYDILDSTFTALDETPTKLASYLKSTLAKAGSTNILVAEATDKCMITARFATTREFSQLQLIYGSRTIKNLSCAAFQSHFLRVSIWNITPVFELKRLWSWYVLYIEKVSLSMHHWLFSYIITWHSLDGDPSLSNPDNELVFLRQ